MACIRAKAHIGILELAAALGLLAPLLVGALALALKTERKKAAALYITALAASFIALRLNCSRIGMIAAPLLSAMMFAANWRAFGWKAKAVAAVLIILAIFSSSKDETLVGRFQEMGVPSGNVSNDTRKLLWMQGLKVFREHPVLGAGPDAVPSPSLEEMPKYPDGATALAWKPYLTSHQVFITVMSESGLIGLIAFLALYFSPLLFIWKSLLSRDPEIFFWSWAALAVTGQFFLNSLTDNIFGLRPLMYVYWTTTAIALWLQAYKRANGDKGDPKPEMKWLGGQASQDM
jgi:O-antigen ligase